MGRREVRVSYCREEVGRVGVESSAERQWVAHQVLASVSRRSHSTLPTPARDGLARYPNHHRTTPTPTYPP